MELEDIDSKAEEGDSEEVKKGKALLRYMKRYLSIKEVGAYCIAIVFITLLIVEGPETTEDKSGG